MSHNTDTQYATTGTFWVNICGSGENFMPTPIAPHPDCFPGVWKLKQTNVIMAGHGEAHSSLFITWTWRRV